MDDSQNVFEPGALSRRGFLKGSAVAAVSAGALSSLVACAPSSPAPKEGLAGTAGATSVDEGIWIAAACWDNCGGRCVNRVLVRDGEVVRQGSETSHEDSFEWLQQRGCPRGRARAQQVFGGAHGTGPSVPQKAVGARGVGRVDAARHCEHRFAVALGVGHSGHGAAFFAGFHHQQRRAERRNEPVAL